MTDWSYSSSVAYLEAMPRHAIVPAEQVGMRRMSYLLDRLGNPQHSIRVVHVAGSTGKGSTCALIAEGLLAAGYTVGLFRSPHLWSYRERIALNGEDIAEGTWLRAFSLVQPIADSMSAGGDPGYSLGRPSHGEFLLAMALLAYRDQGVEWAVIETGMGGRLDATNVLQSAVAVITNVSLEHTRILGSTIEEIAREKAAIIKAGSIAVVGSPDRAVVEAVERRAREVGAPVVRASESVSIETSREDTTGQDIVVRTSTWSMPAHLSLLGGHQRRNVAAAVAALDAVRPLATRLNPETIVRALSRVRVPGRVEMVASHPPILLDGAQSTAGAEALGAALDTLFPETPITLLFAAMADKDLGAMARALGPRARQVVVTRAPGTPRAASTSLLAATFAPFCPCISECEEVSEALRTARAAAREGLLVVAGSLYLVGWVRHSLLAVEVTR